MDSQSKAGDQNRVSRRTNSRRHSSFDMPDSLAITNFRLDDFPEEPTIGQMASRGANGFFTLYRGSYSSPSTKPIPSKNGAAAGAHSATA